MLQKSVIECAAKMTISDRLEIYKDSLERIKEGFEKYMCVAIKEVFKKRFKQFYELSSNEELEEISAFFPEFIKYKPKTMFRRGLWFENSDKKSRIELLDKVIKDTQKIINS